MRPTGVAVLVLLLAGAAAARASGAMPTVRPARFRVTCVANGFAFLKRLGGRQRADRGIDMTRSTEGGSETAPGRRALRLRDSHAFPQGHPNQLGGGFTEVRTVELTIRKLR